MVWTDIFIKRPVLSVVVSLLILLIGFRAATTPADPAVSETVEYGGQRHHRLSRRVGRSDSGLHHHADRAGRRVRRRRRLHDLVFGAGHQHHPGLHQAEFRSEPGADRSPRQGEFGQIPDSEGIERPDRDQDDRPDHGGDVSRLLQRSAVGLGDLGLSDAGGSAGAFDRRRRRLGRYSRRPDLRDAAVARSRPHGRPQRLAGRRFGRDRRQQLPGRGGPGQGLFHRLQRLDQYRPEEPRPVQAHDRQIQGRRLRAHGGHRHRRTRGAEHRRQRRLQRRARDLHRRAGDAARQPADAGQGRPRAVPGARTQSAAVDEDEGGLRFDQIHPILDRRGREDARRGGHHRGRGDLPVPRLVPLGGDPGGDHSAVAGRRLQPDADRGIQFQPVDAAGDGAGDRARGRRRHRGGGKHPPPSGGGQTAGAGGDAGRARDRRSRHLHDHHARRGVCADRLPRRPHRFAVPRIRLHAGRRGDRFRRGRADAVADDVLDLPQERRGGTVCKDRQPGVRIDDALVWPAARSFARLPPDHGAVRADHSRAGRLPLSAHVEGTRAGGRPGHRVRRDQGAEIRQHRLFRTITARSSTRCLPASPRPTCASS